MSSTSWVEKHARPGIRARFACMLHQYTPWAGSSTTRRVCPELVRRKGWATDIGVLRGLAARSVVMRGGGVGRARPTADSMRPKQDARKAFLPRAMEPVRPVWGQLAGGKSRNSRRRILPTLVFGNSERNSTYFGCL